MTSSAQLPDLLASVPEEIRATDLALLEQSVAVATAMAASLDAVVVETAEQRAEAVTAGKQAKDALESIETARDAAVRPLNARVKAINAFAKERLAGPLDAAVGRLKGRIVALDGKLAKEREEAAKKLREEQDRIAAAEKEKLEKLASDKAETARIARLEEYRQGAEAICAEHPPGPVRAEALRRLRAIIDGKLAEYEAQVAKAASTVQVDAAVARAQVGGQLETLAATKGAGATKRWTWDRVNYNMSIMPREYLKLDEAAVTKAVQQGARVIPGIRIFEEAGVRL